MEAIIAGSRLKREYIQAVIDIRSSQDKNGLYREALERRNRIEQALPLATLTYFRQCAMRELCEAERKKKRSSTSSTGSDPAHHNAKAEKSAKSSWFGLWGSQPKPTTQRGSVDTNSRQEDISIEELQHELEIGIEAEVKFVARVSLKGLVVGIHFSDSNLQPISTAIMKLSSSTSFHSDATRLEFHVESCSIEDKCSVRPAFDYILSGLSPDKPAAFHINGAMESTKTTVDVRSDPLQINWNEECIRAMFAYLTATPTTTCILYPIVLFKTKTKFEVPVSNDLVFKMDLFAPLFVFPEMQTSLPQPSWSYLVFDAGRLSTLAKTDRGLFTCQTTLSRVGVGMSSNLNEALIQGNYDV